MKNVRVIGRNTQGVNLFRLAVGEKVVGMDRIAEPSGDEDAEDADDIETETPAED
jgi:DNA gyrase subunit A